MPTEAAPLILSGKEQALVVLGCRVRDGAPSAAMERRLQRALAVHNNYPTLSVIMSGGRVWDGHAECAIMARWWEESGKSNENVHLEDQSQTTQQNAFHVARLCERLGYRDLVLVTCDYHMKRAHRLFEQQRLEVTLAPAYARRSALSQARLAVREWGASVLGKMDPWRP